MKAPKTVAFLRRISSLFMALVMIAGLLPALSLLIPSALSADPLTWEGSFANRSRNRVYIDFNYPIELASGVSFDTLKSSMRYYPRTADAAGLDMPSGFTLSIEYSRLVVKLSAPISESDLKQSGFLIPTGMIAEKDNPENTNDEVFFRNITYDSADIAAKSYYLDRDNKTMYLYFTEPVYNLLTLTSGASPDYGFRTNVGIAQLSSSKSTGSITPTDLTKPNPGFDAVMDSKNSLIILNFDEPLTAKYNYIYIYPNTLSDRAGNGHSKAIVFGPMDATIDWSPPRLHSAIPADRTPDSKRVTIPWDKKILKNLNDSELRLQVTYGYFSVPTYTREELAALPDSAFDRFLDPSDTIEIKDNLMTINFATPLPEGYYAFRIKSGSVKSTVEVVQSQTQTTNIIDIYADLTAPAFVGYTLRPDRRTIVLSFSENIINNAQYPEPVSSKDTLTALIEISRDGSGANFERLSAYDDWEIQGPDLIITLAEALTEERNFIRIARDNAIADTSYNQLGGTTGRPLINFSPKPLIVGPFSAVADMDPPVLVSAASGADLNSLILEFNEKIAPADGVTAAQLLQRISVSEWTDTESGFFTRLDLFDPGASVTLSDSTLTIMFSAKLTTPERPRVYVKVRIDGSSIRDTSALKNVRTDEIRSDAVVFVDDIVPPDLLRPVKYTLTQSRLEITYNEPIKLAPGVTSEGLLSRVFIAQSYTGSVDSPVYSSGLFRAMTLAQGVPSGKTPSVTVSGNKLIVVFGVQLSGDSNMVMIWKNTISDLAGNVQPNDQFTALFSAKSDVYPPVFKDFSLSNDNRLITLSFADSSTNEAEDIFPAVVDMEDFKSNVGFAKTLEASAAPDRLMYRDLAEGDRLYINGNNLIIELATPLDGRYNYFRILGGVFMDENHNVQPAITHFGPVDASLDRLPPTFNPNTGVTLDTNPASAGYNRTVTLTFNDEHEIANAFADPVLFKAAIQFASKSTFRSLGPNDTVEIFGRTVRITFEFPLMGSTNKLRIEKRAICDTSPYRNGYSAEDGYFVTNSIAAHADTLPPAFNPLNGVQVTADRRTVILTFSEPVYSNRLSNTALKSSVMIARDGSKFTELSVNDSVVIPQVYDSKTGGYINSNKLQITLSTPISGNKTKFRIIAETLKDSAGNVIKGAISTDAINADDIEGPQFHYETGITINDATKKVVTLAFNEEIISGHKNANDLKAPITIARDGTNFRPLDASDKVTISGGKLQLTFSTPLEGNLNRIHLTAGSVSDKSRNALRSAVTTGPIYATQPSYDPVTGLYVRSDNKLVRLRFDRDIYSAAKTPANLKSAVKVSRNNSALFSPLSEGDTVDVIAGELVITFYSPIDSTTRITVAGRNLKDAVGNIVREDITTGPYDYLEATFDNEKGFSLSNTRKVLTLTFSKPIRNNTASYAALKNNITFSSDGKRFSKLSALDEVSIQDGRLVISFAEPLMGENNYVRIASGSLKDDFGLRLSSSVTAGPIVAGDIVGRAGVSVGGRPVDSVSIIARRGSDKRMMSTIDLRYTALKHDIEAAASGSALEIQAPDELLGSAVEGCTVLLDGRLVRAMLLRDMKLVFKRKHVAYILPMENLDLGSVTLQLGYAASDFDEITFAVSLTDTAASLVDKMKQNAGKNGFTVVTEPMDFNLYAESSVRTVPVDRYLWLVERRFEIPSDAATLPNLTAVTLDKNANPVHIPSSLVSEGGRHFIKALSLTNSSYVILSSVKTPADVYSWSWAKKYIDFMTGRFLMSGDTKGNFNQSSNMTRGEFASTIVRAMGLMKSGVGVDRFSDVLKSSWYYDHVSIAVDFSLMNGNGDGTFAADSFITREQAFVTVYNALCVIYGKSSMTDAEATAILSRFKDGHTVSPWARIPLAECAKRNILLGDDKDMIKPSSNIARDQVASLIRNFLYSTGLTD